MTKLRVIVDKHPSCFLFFKFLSSKLKNDSYFKGSFKYELEGNKYVGVLELEKYIPRTFVFLGFSFFIASAVLWLLQLSSLVAWMAALPGLFILVIYWLLQSAPFYYLLIYISLRKRGYRGKVLGRFS